jgi:DNA-binding MarR family transcriptional regulator
VLWSANSEGPIPSKKASARLRVAPGEFLRLDNQLCFPLYAASRLVVQAYAPLLETLGLTYPQYLVLMILWEHDGVTVREIGERLYLDSGTLTPLLKRLCAAGLITRVRSAGDERAVENWLTRAGRALKDRAARVPTEMLCRLGMEGPDVVQLRATLKELLARLAHVVESGQVAPGE